MRALLHLLLLLLMVFAVWLWTLIQMRRLGVLHAPPG